MNIINFFYNYIYFIFKFLGYSFLWNRPQYEPNKKSYSNLIINYLVKDNIDIILQYTYF